MYRQPRIDQVHNIGVWKLDIDIDTMNVFTLPGVKYLMFAAVV